jgi:mRNA-degrading endonuclease toxin of MazEF toxin-antitoxin module
LKPGDVVVGVLAGALGTKVRPAVVIASSAYLVERPDVLVGILTTKLPKTIASTGCVLSDWQSADLRAVSPTCSQSAARS